MIKNILTYLLMVAVGFLVAMPIAFYASGFGQWAGTPYTVKFFIGLLIILGISMVAYYKKWYGLSAGFLVGVATLLLYGPFFDSIIYSFTTSVALVSIRSLIIVSIYSLPVVLIFFINRKEIIADNK